MIKLQEKDTAQETFDFIVVKLREQGAPSEMDGSCLYGEPGGIRCAIGHLMGNYHTGSRQNLYELVEVECLVEKPKHYSLLKEIQRAHDWAVSVNGHNNDWPNKCAFRLVKVAEQFDLNPGSAEEWVSSLWAEL